MSWSRKLRGHLEAPPRCRH
ncbi:unnamed protein product [Spirodela intermedia]|uniref:Uncharacterized protein n=2 Tax=Spirodela intermedia TaxID=51605 RepID=A0A7I8LK10_SPIIN|nr:unnamed protein product [Spirodela intermedia]CAA6673173.1 unnamed protein product [Spirodela intermedia]CAA7410393.1 unnamed protein product [Spirodela intermedia]